MADTIIVTRHEALVEYIYEIGLAPSGTPVIPDAGEDDVRGRHVIGVLPMHLAAVAESLTTVPLSVPRDQNYRGRELTLDEVRQFAGPPQRFHVRTLPVERKHWMASITHDGSKRVTAHDSFGRAFDHITSWFMDDMQPHLVAGLAEMHCVEIPFEGGYAYASIEECPCGAVSRETCVRVRN